MAAPSSLALWLLPTLVLVAIGMIAVLDRIFEQQARQRLRDHRLTLRRLHSERKEIELTAQAFSGSDPEPYRSQAEELQERLVSIRAATGYLERKHVALNERAASLKHRRRVFIIGQPYSWRKLGKDAASFESEARSLYPAIEVAAGFGEELRRLPWITAQQSRTLLSRLRAVSRRLKALQDGGLYGDTFENIISIERDLQASLSQIPAPFLEWAEVELIQADPRQDTALVYELNLNNTARLAELSAKVIEWEAEFLTTQEKVAGMLQSHEELKIAMERLPSGLEISAEKIVLRQLDTIGETLKASAARLEVESMPLVAKEAERLRQASQEKRQEIESIAREHASLDMLIIELEDGFRDLSLQLAALSNRSLYPVKWEVSLEALAELNSQSETLEEVKSARTPAQVSEDFKTAAGILAGLKEIEAAAHKVTLAHADLTALLQSPEISGLADWLQSSRKLIAEAQKFGHENWGRLSDFSSLVSDIDLLADEAGTLMSANQTEPISELRIEARLAEARRISAMQQRLRAGVEKIAARLTNLKRSEQEAGEKIEGLQKALSQFRLIVNSNPFLAGIALQEIDRLMRKTNDLQQELLEKGRGSIEKKARQVEALESGGFEAANRWLGLLEKEIQTVLNDLSSRLAELDQIAHLEDPSVAEAHRLLTSLAAPDGSPIRSLRQENGSGSENDRPRNKAQEHENDRPQLTDLMLEYKHSSDAWQEITAAQKALEDVLHLLETYRQASNQRDQARRRITETEGWSALKRSWPPAAMGLESERQELDRLEAEWAALKKRSAKAIALVGLYSSLGSRYQNLAEKVSQSAGQRMKQQTQVEELGNQIAEQAGQWENLMNEHSDNLNASREIARFLEDLDDSLQEIENGYLQGDLEYEDVLYRMNAALRRARYFQVALDDDHALDVNGRVLRRR